MIEHTQPGDPGETALSPHVAAQRTYYPAPTTASASEPPTKVTIGLVLNAVSRWWKVALPAGLLLALTGVGIVWLVFVPKYESTALLRIKDQTPYIVFDTKDQSQKFVATQIHLMTRRTILADALKGIEGIPELVRHKDPIEWLQTELKVQPVGNSELFEVVYQGRSPQGAKAVVDAVVMTYLDYSAKHDDLETRRVIELLDQERVGRKRLVERLREQVRDKSKELTGKDPYNPAGFSVVSIQTPLVSLLNKRVATDVELQVLEARLQAYEEKSIAELAPSEQAMRTAVEANPEVIRLKNAITQTRSTLLQYTATTRDAESSTAYRRYQQEIAGFEDALSKLRDELVEGGRNAVLAQTEQRREERLRELRSQIDQFRLTTQLLTKQFEKQVKELERSGGDSLDLEFYRTELAREEKVFELISDRTLALKTELAAPGRVKCLDPANTPIEPVALAPWIPLLVVTLVGLCAPFGIAILWEKSANRVGDASSLQKSDLNVVAEIAALPVKSQRGSQFSNDRSKRELSLFEESIDSLRTGLRLSRALKDLQVLAVSSAVSREGKTSLAAQLAVSIARASGEKTLLIDADMRAPNVHQIFQISNERGMADVLAKTCDVNEAVCTDYSELLHLLPAGELKASPHKLVGDDSFSHMISRLRQDYRYIIIDTPPVLSAGESLVLSVAADATLICAMRNFSRTEQVRDAYDRLVKADARPIGIVLNGVPAHRYSYSYGRYGYGQYAYQRRG